MTNLVSAKWLKENFNNENMVIVDCRFDLMDKNYGKKSYEKNHIQGAVRVDIETELSSKVQEHGGRHPLPSIDKLKTTFENLGISNNSIVVCYDEGDLAGPSRLWWILKYLGHNEVYVLGGGINEFISIGGTADNKTPNIPKKGNFTVNVNESMRVDMKYVKERLYKDNVAIIDSRENKRYLGEFEPVDIKAGHIPSAINYFWMDILEKNGENMNIKCVEDLKKHFEKLNNYDEVIVYCGSGITACPNSLALSEIGIDHKVYSGSFSDWVSYNDNDVNTTVQ
ncbi:sulfurtransferase [Paraclostridium ghonii]|uniref:Thiosulfate/3-mercaptopyruvate sulfurtransferase n=1 Tax=Paraclostridium ghonii TaxID=29358 RepID=A0ABU0MWY1_9FIRM|nr:sulfurtransferase [Paeniclostridium ghonii]MDQ0555419.1 thiosulfate/3-mercaptopyruvate sulfurtransferase [Paeniclostridium ghonii]